MFLEIPDLLTSEEVAKLRAIAERAPFVDGRITNPYATFKNNMQLDSKSPLYAESSALLHTAFMRNEGFINFAQPKAVAPPLLTKHEQGMSYGAHSDAAFMAVGPLAFRSDLSATIFLSEPNAYEGGELCVHLGTRPVLFKMPAGGAIVYPSNTLHEVKPVRSGVRLVAITFIESRITNANHREMLYELAEVAALEGLGMKWQSRVRLSGVIQTLLREWS